MEHNWGRTIHEMGLGGTGATLAARLLEYPLIVLTNAVHPVFTDRTLWWITRDNELPFFAFDNITGGLPFPYYYGDIVEPDFNL